MANNGNNKKPGKPMRFNPIWLYAPVFLILATLFFVDRDITSQKELSWNEFQNIAKKQAFTDIVVNRKENTLKARVDPAKVDSVFKKGDIPSFQDRGNISDYYINTHLTGFFPGLFAAKTDKVIVLDDLGTDKPFFKIGVDDTGTLRCFASAEECPSPYLIAPGRKVGLKIQQVISSFDQTAHAGFFQTDLFEEHLPLFVCLQFGDLALYLGCYDEDFCIFVFVFLVETRFHHVGQTGLELLTS